MTGPVHSDPDPGATPGATLPDEGQATSFSTAVLNILEDFAEERQRSTETQRAILNILDDFAAEQPRIEETQRALLNILEDFDIEKTRVAEVNHELLAEIEERRRIARALEARTNDLARSNADLEMFAYVASHDLSEPLRAISGPVSLLARRYGGQLDDRADQYIGFAVDGCHRMQALIDDLLTYSRVGRVEGPRERVDCNQVAATALRGLGKRVSETGAQITVGELPVVSGHVSPLTQVFQNLLSNAVKFTAPGVTPQVQLTAERWGREGGGRDWRFSVTDNGIGIEPRHLDRVFGMFKRLHARDAYPGTGIGLALCKKIVENHRGSIGVDSVPGGGSCFWFVLPEGEDEQ